MNDFTKEELKILHAMCFDFERRMLAYQDMGEAAKTPSLIKNKIQSMIDSYCDHIWTDGGGNNIFCGLCHIHGGKR